MTINPKTTIPVSLDREQRLNIEWKFPGKILGGTSPSSLWSWYLWLGW